jgi:hypothetical protein
MFLVLPVVPDSLPDWLAAFERITIAPKSNDIVFLCNVLEDALPVELRRSGQGPALPVVVQPDNPDAIPIAPQYLRTEFTKTPDRFYADVGTANGRLTDGSFDPPPADFVRELSTLGLESTGILTPGCTLTPHQSWPFIAASLALQGTPGPIWFLIRRTSDVDQLEALLNTQR